jgi:protease II
MRKFITLAIASCYFLSSFAQYNYPATKTVDGSNTYFGVNYKDSYRWLQNFKDSAVVIWFRQQADLSNSILNKISGRDELIAEWKMLDKLQPPRMELAPNGPANIPEFGTVKDSVECRALYEMDGVEHVVKNTNYPAVICIGRWNDPRVIAWEPGKFAAALQNATTSGKPVIMKVNYDNGHFTEDKSITFANFADQFAFAMCQCGHPDFQLQNYCKISMRYEL